MKKIKFAETLMLISVVFFLIYNTVFGWNRFAISEAEKTCNFIFEIAVYSSWIIYFLPLLDVYKNFIKNHEERRG